MTDTAKTGGYAFPVSAGHVDLSGNPLNYPEFGMTLRDWFATHAPAEIPFWFKHTPLPRPAPAPGWDTLATDEHKETARNWLASEDREIDELPDELRPWGESVLAASVAIADWQQANNVAAFIQWRWAYADAMIAQRAADHTRWLEEAGQGDS